jgi:ferredoxin-nitrite reductase
MHPDEVNELARLADTYGNGQVRLTTGQNAIIPNVPAARVDSLLEEDLLQTFSPFPPPLRRGLVVCTGTDFCNLAQIDTKAHAAELSTKLEQRLGTADSPLKMHWSGCPAGCGNHLAADIGFRGLKARIDGKMVDAVAIYVGGRTGPHAVPGRQIVKVTPCDSTLPDVVASVIRKFDPLAEPGQSFEWQVPVMPEFSRAQEATEKPVAEAPGSASAD